MRQLLYVSSCTAPVIGEGLSTVLLQSRRNNPVNGLTGLLWTDGARFLQVLEGDEPRLLATFARIREDERHRGVVVLHHREILERTFGAWSMALVSDPDDGIALALAGADPVVRGTFEGLIKTRRVAA
jgi:hypothetical protein